MKILINFLRNLVFIIIYKNINIYYLILKISNFSDFLLPHEKEIYGFKKLKYNKNKFLIDVGSGNGLFLRSINKIGYNGKAICIDPLYENKIIFKNIVKNNKKILFYSKAVSNKKKIYLYTPFTDQIKLNNWTSKSKKEIIENLKAANFNLDIKKIKFYKKKFNCIKLNNFIKKKIAIIKIDVEGSELNVIKSGINLIKKHKPIIYLENNKRKKNETNFVKIRPILNKYNYKCFFYDYNKDEFNEKYTDQINNIFFLIEKKHLIK